jgi:hypothetical protein
MSIKISFKLISNLQHIKYILLCSLLITLPTDYRNRHIFLALSLINIEYPLRNFKFT